MIFVDPRTYRLLQLVEQGKTVYIATKRWELEERQRREAMPRVDGSFFFGIDHLAAEQVSLGSQERAAIYSDLSSLYQRANE